MNTRSFDTTIEFCVNGHSCERDVTVHYEYEPAGGDGWHEPRYGERAIVCTVELEHEAKRLDLLPLLSDAVITALEADCLENESAQREFRDSEAADWLREREYH